MERVNYLFERSQNFALVSKPNLKNWPKQSLMHWDLDIAKQSYFVFVTPQRQAMDAFFISKDLFRAGALINVTLNFCLVKDMSCHSIC